MSDYCPGTAVISAVAAAQEIEDLEQSRGLSDFVREAKFQPGGGTRLFRAPGRVNLIGEHTDYNEGFVLPAAIRFSTWAAARPRDDDMLTVRSDHFPDTRDFSVRVPPYVRTGHWSDYVAGVLYAALREGIRLRGADLIIRGEVPIGAGLSSSAALETVVAIALLSLSNVQLDRTHIALLCQRAERDFVGVQVGIMDQFVCGHAGAGSALLLDCRSLRFERKPLPEGIAIVICDTMKRHSLPGSDYNQRRRECHEGVEELSRHIPGVRALRDVPPEKLEANARFLRPVVYRRCRHVVHENARVLQASRALDRGELSRFGRLMYESHQSLRNDYEVSCPELDTLVSIAASLPGVYGARMTGGGFGGCTVNIVRESEVENFRRHVCSRYFAATRIEPAIYVTGAAQGAEEITVSEQDSRES
ncbi:MAG TPA: galactokinase [Bryobacteraceae bacterium]|jgi:galactokinase